MILLIDEDYWYANVTCRIDQWRIYPCEEIYFQKNTEIPLRFVQVIRRADGLCTSNNKL